MATSSGIPSWSPNLARPEAGDVLKEIIKNRYGDPSEIVSIKFPYLDPSTGQSDYYKVEVETSVGNRWVVRHGEYEQQAWSTKTYAIDPASVNWSGYVTTTANTSKLSFQAATVSTFKPGSITASYIDDGRWEILEDKFKAGPTRYFVLVPSEDEEVTGLVPKEVSKKQRDQWKESPIGKLHNESLVTTDIGDTGWKVLTMFATESNDKSPELFVVAMVDTHMNVMKQEKYRTHGDAFIGHRRMIAKAKHHIAKHWTGQADIDLERQAALALGIFGGDDDDDDD